MSAPGFPSPFLTSYSSLICYATKQHTHSPRHLLISTVTRHLAIWVAKVVKKLNMSHSFAFVRCSAGPKYLNGNEGRNYKHTHTHICVCMTNGTFQMNDIIISLGSCGRQILSGATVSILDRLGNRSRTSIASFCPKCTWVKSQIPPLCI